MRNFVDSFIRFLINTVIIIIMLGACLIGFVVFFAKTNHVSIEDTLAYAQVFKGETINTISITPQDETTNIAKIADAPIAIVDPNVSTTSVPVVPSSKGFYYAQLDANAQKIYDALNLNMENLKKNNYIIDFGKDFNTLLNEPNGQTILNVAFQSALDAFFYDHPELFYIDLTKISLLIQYTTFGPITTYKVSLSPDKNVNYLNSSFSTETQANQAIANVENIKNSITEKISKADSDYDKALKVHDALVNMINYDSSQSNIHNIYGALNGKSAVCEGYAKAFKYILDSLDIECILVNGTATNSSGETESHMWNYIKLNGIWYGVDVTWDDPVIVGGTKKNNLRHTYFCKGNTVFSKSHKISNTISDQGKAFQIPALSNSNF